jgi:2-polyprenyl-3-methyl-5-hydroxy-6-metoxy-1,4-benzoquinol methylase
MAVDARELEVRAAIFQAELDSTKRRIGPDFPWYPYPIMDSLTHVRPLLEKFPLETLVTRRVLADIGAADGDMSFFLERLGYKAEIIDHHATNYNGLRGARRLAEHLNSPVVIHDINLDSMFELAQASYDLVFFLGILYHLKNPFYVMERLAKAARHMLVSTRIARYAPNGTKIKDVPAAYLLTPTESNNDATNFWVFTESGLLRLFDRTGWDVLACRSVGDTSRSQPARADRDERAFALLRSRTPPG